MNAFSSVITTLLGVGLGWGLNQLTIDRTVKHQEFYKAATSFRTAFIDEIHSLENELNNNKELAPFFASTLLTEAYPKQNKAYITFREYLNKETKFRFDKAWKEYLMPEGGVFKDSPSPFIDYGCEYDERISTKLALTQINKVLKFASPI